MHSGFIKLCDKYGHVVDNKPYKTVGERKAILKSWMEMYAAGYQRCSLQIEPNTSDNINEDGTNKWKRPMRIQQKY
jgi:hypothetical protein